MNQLTQEAIELIKHFESLHDGDESEVGLQPKLCPAGIATIGWGHAVSENGEFLRGAKGLARALELYPAMTEDEAESLLKHDLNNFAVHVTTLLRVPVTDGQYSALVSLCYNIGINAFRTSTVLRELNEGNFTKAANAFRMWVKSGGKELKGLVRRREAERRMFLNDWN